MSKSNSSKFGDLTTRFVQETENAGLTKPGEGVAEWARRALEFEADALQSQVLDSESPRLMLCCSRQWGKSTVTSVRAVWEAIRHPGALVLAAAPCLRQSGEFLRKVRGHLRRLEMKVRTDGVNPLSLLLENDSRLVALPGEESTVRGYSAARLLVVDEASRVPDALYYALRPILATSGGALWLMSTPHGQRGFFHEEWVHGGEGWTRFSARAEECPRIAKEFLQREREALGERWYRQEYCCEFAASEDQMFTRELIDSAISPEAEPLKVW